MVDSHNSDGINKYDYIVDKKGNGDYEDIQSAIDGAKSFPPEKIDIFVKDGIYNEKIKVHSWNPHINLIGESKEDTVISFDDHFEKIARGRNSTFFTYTLKIQGNNFYAKDLTVENTAGPIGQAIALHVESDRAMFENCQFIGNQDTVYAAGGGARQYFKDCYIEGTTDYIFGNSTAVFEGCNLFSKDNSYITGASTPKGECFGYVFLDCNLTSDSEITEVYLGRPWRDHAHVAFIQSYLGNHIHPDGWHNWSRSEAEKTVKYVEYANSGPGAEEANRRVSWSDSLSQSEAKEYTKENILGQNDGEKSIQHWYKSGMKQN